MNRKTSTSLVDQVERIWPRYRWLKFGVVVAVSGGADSVALLRTLHEIRESSSEANLGSLTVAHFNHRLRGRDSDADSEFVKQLASDLGLPIECGVQAESLNKTREEELRDIRYRFVEKVALNTGSRYIATAHHRNDQVETVLFRLFRGTGVAGLAGIPFSRNVNDSLTVVRPLLNVDRKSIESALMTWKQPWRDDSTNVESNYTRNFIRNDVLPMLRERFRSVDESVLRLSKQAAQQRDLLTELTEPLFAAVTVVDGGVNIDCASLCGSSPVLLRELLLSVFKRQSWPTSQIGFRELNKLADMVHGDQDVALFQLPGGIGCRKKNRVIELKLPFQI